MLHEGVRSARPIETNIIVVAISLLLGILVMAYGFFYNNSQFTYVGIFITAVVSWATLLIALTRRNSRRLTTRG
jgi:hypothetical protein